MSNFINSNSFINYSGDNIFKSTGNSIDLSFSQAQKNLLIGTLLGDGNLQTQTQDGSTWRYRAVHKAAHERYCRDKYELLAEFCGADTSVSYSDIFDARTNKTYKRVWFNTLTKPEFKEFADLFYTKLEDGSYRKRVPENIGDLLNPEVLAWWYQDDGALKWSGHSDAVRLCTDSFTYGEVNLLKTALETKFGLKPTIQKQRGHCRLYIPESDYPILSDTIANLLSPVMYYKFPDGNKGVYQGEDLSEDIKNTFDAIEQDPEVPDL